VYVVTSATSSAESPLATSHNTCQCIFSAGCAAVPLLKLLRAQMPFYADTAAHAVAPEEGSGRDCALLSSM
jgi:hypothetical protein